jgi:hypothetical protein
MTAAAPASTERSEQPVPAPREDRQNGHTAAAAGSFRKGGRDLASDLLAGISVASALARDPRTGQARRR